MIVIILLLMLISANAINNDSAAVSRVWASV